MADAAGLDANQNFAGADRGSWDFFDIDDTVAAIDGGVHRLRYHSQIKIAQNRPQLRICNRQRNPRGFLPPWRNEYAGAAVPASGSPDGVKPLAKLVL